jgi:hypothetical protein
MFVEYDILEVTVKTQSWRVVVTVVEDDNKSKINSNGGCGGKISSELDGNRTPD